MPRKRLFGEEGKAHRKVVILQRVKEKAEGDLHDLQIFLPASFISTDIGHALWKRARHWSEHQGVIQRWLRFGMIVEVGRETFGRGARTRRRWAFVD